MTPDVDVAIIGDGPAGTALARACTLRGIDAVLLGDDDPWSNTYGLWLDDLDGLEAMAQGVLPQVQG